MRSRGIYYPVGWGLLCLALFLGACAPRAAEFPAPSPGMAPQEVVRTQLNALRAARADMQDAESAIAAAYAYASPRNKQAVGSMQDFAGMIRSNYNDMIEHRKAVIKLVEQSEREAAVSASLINDNAPPSNYIFLLRKQTGSHCNGCWMTDAVLPVQADSPGALQAI